MSTKAIAPRGDGEGSIGTLLKKWGAVFANAFNGCVLSETSGTEKIPKANASGILDASWLGGEKAPVNHTHETYLPVAGGTLTGKLDTQATADPAVKQMRNITISTEAPSNGANGDVWLQYE